jgi:hypothetical protein
MFSQVLCEQNTEVGSQFKSRASKIGISGSGIGLLGGSSGFTSENSRCYLADDSSSL